eukprot:SAG22_NODE_50_length_24611_cov_74.139687_2_plen_697_part_00
MGAPRLAVLLLAAPILSNSLTGKTEIMMKQETSLATILGGYRVDQGFGLEVGGRIDVKISAYPQGSDLGPAAGCEDIAVDNFEGHAGFGCEQMARLPGGCHNESWGALYGIKYSARDACCGCGGGLRPGDLARTPIDVLLLTQEQMYIALRLQESDTSRKDFETEQLHGGSSMGADGRGATRDDEASRRASSECSLHPYSLKCQRQFVDHRLCMMPSSYRQQVFGSVELSYVPEHRNKYTLALVSCAGPPLRAEVSLEIVNPRPDGQGWSHLPAEHILLPDMYYGIAQASTSLLAIWVLHVAPYPQLVHRQLQRAGWPWPQRERGEHRAPLLIFVYTCAAAGKCVELWTTAMFYAAYAADGTEPLVLTDVRDYTVVFTSAFAMCAMMLAALGWRTIRDTITARERNLMYGGLLLYASSGVAYKMCGTDCSVYVLLHYVLQFLLSFGIIVAMNANIERLRAQAIEGSVSDFLEHTLWQLLRLQSFRWAFLAYLIIPFLMLSVQVMALSWWNEWLALGLSDLIEVGSYVILGWAYSPFAFSPVVTGATHALAALPGADERMRPAWREGRRGMRPRAGGVLDAEIQAVRAVRARGGRGGGRGGGGGGGDNGDGQVPAELGVDADGWQTLPADWLDPVGQPGAAGAGDGADGGGGGGGADGGGGGGAAGRAGGDVQEGTVVNPIQALRGRMAGGAQEDDI